MITQVSKPGFKNKNFNGRKTRDCKIVFLTHTPIGCCIKIIIELAWESLDGFRNTVVSREFKKAGIIGDKVREEVIQFLPEIEQWYREQGSEFTSNIAYNRGHKGCAYRNKGVTCDPKMRGTLSDEHYTSDPKLIRFSRGVQLLWSKKDPITIADLQKVVDEYFERS